MIKLLPMSMCLLMLISCGEAPENQDEAVLAEEEIAEVPEWDPREGMEQWADRWNRQDAAGLNAVTAEEAILLKAGETFRRDSVRVWIDTNAPVMRNLDLQPEVTDISGDIAYEAGTYTHNIANNDTLEIAGAYTIVWQRQDDGTWKVQLMDIDEVQS